MAGFQKRQSVSNTSDRKGREKKGMMAKRREGTLFPVNDGSNLRRRRGEQGPPSGIKKQFQRGGGWAGKSTRSRTCQKTQKGEVEKGRGQRCCGVLVSNKPNCSSNDVKKRLGSPWQHIRKGPYKTRQKEQGNETKSETTKRVGQG